MVCFGTPKPQPVTKNYTNLGNRPNKFINLKTTYDGHVRVQEQPSAKQEKQILMSLPYMQGNLQPSSETHKT